MADITPIVKGQPDWHIPINDLINAFTQMTYPGAGTHNGFYRGKLLGNAVTDEQYAVITSGTFDDLYIGDYWAIDGVNYRIAAFDYYYNTGDGDNALTTHHAVIVPDTILYSAAMNTTNITTGGYTGSAMYTTNLADAKTIIKAAFTGHVLTHREYLTNAMTNGRPSGAAWFDSEIELMNERMVYGNAVFSPVSDGSSIPANNTFNKSQLPLFALRPDLISIRAVWWLRDPVSATHFTDISTHGYASCVSASNAYGVRPAFSIS